MTTEKKQKLQSAIREMRQRYHDGIAVEIAASAKTYALIAEEYGVSEQTVYLVAKMRGLGRTASEPEANHG